jgi:hypothetical protein
MTNSQAQLVNLESKSSRTKSLPGEYGSRVDAVRRWLAVRAARLNRELVDEVRRWNALYESFRSACRGHVIGRISWTDGLSAKVR